ncbi:TlpA family protein disulfide reductase [Undibacterium amnicola]|uniref:TlpA family protein disulfide reductase n=1 Tax=Undibacterium amnicola TaxID=1834038 RepID=A0ABR6XQ19_9BURK|nr:TlpA family protein disulfide reductase [Undibacterium amnicola]
MLTSLIAPIVLSVFLLSCSAQCLARQIANAVAEKVEASSVNEYDNKYVNLEPEIELKELTKDFQQWWNYTYYNIRLGKEFIGLDVNSTVLDKENFLKKMSEAKLIAIKLKTAEPSDVYRLYVLDNMDNSMQSIRRTSARIAQTELGYFYMQGKPLPNMDVFDINGKAHNQNSLLGKLTVVKTWFIKCTACIEEFPQANKLVELYQDNPRVQFLSLALDPQAELIKFLEAQPLKYAVVPKMQSYIQNELKLGAYPTHLIVGTDGKIMKVFERLHELETFLETAVTKL